MIGFEMQRRLQSVAAATAVANGRSRAIHAVWAAVGNATRLLEVRDLQKVEGNLGALSLDMVEEEKGVPTTTIPQVALDDVLSGKEMVGTVAAVRSRVSVAWRGVGRKVSE